MGNQCGGEISSSVENSQDADGDEEVEDVTEDMKSEAAVMHNSSAENAEGDNLDIHDTSIDVSEAPHGGNRTENGSYRMPDDPKLTSDSGNSVAKADAAKQQPVYAEAQPSTLQKRKIELIEAEKERQKSQLYESLGDLENERLGGLCKTLFPEKHNSVFGGPHSLFYRRNKPHSKSDIFTAVSSFMIPLPKPACK